MLNKYSAFADPLSSDEGKDLLSFETFINNQFTAKFIKGNHIGLVPILGLPRSGKTTLIRQMMRACTDLSENVKCELIKADEFDCADIDSAMIRSEDLLVEIIENCVFQSIIKNSHDKSILFVDSIKSIFYHSNGGLRVGGISNDCYSHLNFLNLLAKSYDMTLVTTLSTTSLNRTYLEELLSIIAGSTDYMALISSDHKIICDIDDRRSTIQLTKLWLQQEE